MCSDESAGLSTWAFWMFARTVPEIAGSLRVVSGFWSGQLEDNRGCANVPGCVRVTAAANLPLTEPAVPPASSLRLSLRNDRRPRIASVINYTARKFLR